MSIQPFVLPNLISDEVLYRYWTYKINNGEAERDEYRAVYRDRDGNTLDAYAYDTYMAKRRYIKPDQATLDKWKQEAKFHLLPPRLREILREIDPERKEVLRVAEMRRRLAERADIRMEALRHKVRYAAMLYGMVLGGLVATVLLVVAIKALLFTVLG